MKTKKTKRANLENYRTIFLQIGLILTLSAIFVAFEWNSTVSTKKLTFNSTNWEDIEDFPPPTRPKAEVPPKVEPPSFELEVVEDKVEIEDIDLDRLISETDETEAINIVEYDDNEEENVIEDFIKVEIKPRFEGKEAKYFSNYIGGNLDFPITAVETGITGTVKAAFIIDEDGSVSNVEIIRSVHPVIDQAVVKAIQSSPKWEPGMQKGRYVSVRYTIAISFKLE